MSKLSVIVPVYNVENYLDWSLGSLKTQTLDDIDIICVNDGSTDSSRKKLLDYAQQDSRIRIIDKENGGLSSARNAGIVAAESDYICFLDADDRFYPNTCKKIVELLDDSEADVVTFGATCYPTEAGYPWLIDALSPRNAVFDTFSMDILIKEKSRPFVWRTACRADFLKNKGILFDVGLRFGEDQVFQFAIYPRSKKTVLSSLKLYDYRVCREGSLMAGVGDDFHLKMLEHVKILERILADWNTAGFLERYATEMVAFAMDFALYDAIKLDDASYRSVAERLHELLLCYWSREDVAAMPMAPVTKRMALKTCYQFDMPRIARKKLVFDYYLQQYGKKATLKRIFKG